jgi:hypothetical protein
MVCAKKFFSNFSNENNRTINVERTSDTRLFPALASGSRAQMAPGLILCEVEGREASLHAASRPG